MKRPVIAVNISWNDSGWKEPYTNEHAGHSYVREHPGHESLNFKFDKPGIDTKTHVYGFSQWKNYPKEFSCGGYVLFYSKNPKNVAQIVGIYGGVELINPIISFDHEGFENGKLLCNLKAEKELSLELPEPLDAKRYNSGRMVGRIGFTYYDESTLLKIVSDEYALLEKKGEIKSNDAITLSRIYKHVTGRPIPKIIISDPDLIDIEEQNEIESLKPIYDKERIREELKKVKATDSVMVVINNKVYKRDNRTIALLKTLRGHKCQICGKAIEKKDGTFYVEAAHITPKSEKGQEIPSNILLLCPNHHKEFDLGRREILKKSDEELILSINGVVYPPIDMRL